MSSNNARIGTLTVIMDESGDVTLLAAGKTARGLYSNDLSSFRWAWMGLTSSLRPAVQKCFTEVAYTTRISASIR